MKNNIKDLLERIRPLAKEQTTFNICSLLEAYIEQWKEDLVTAKGERVLELQGAIINVKDILSEINRNVKVNTFKDGSYTG